MYRLNLQRFASEKTERATPKRRQEARREGQVPRSPELTTTLVFLGLLVVLRFVGPYMWNSWLGFMQSTFTSGLNTDVNQKTIAGIMTTETWQAAKVVLPLLITAVVVAVLTGVGQTGGLFLVKQLSPDFKRINPLQGFKRLFSLRSGVETVKSILKLIIVSLFAYTAIHGVANQVAEFVSMDIGALPGVIGGMAASLGIQIASAMVALAVLDFVYQRYEFEKSIRMSRDDIKQEMKQMEGDPLIKAQIRRRGRQLAMRRMMQEVPKADVVITNPTHFSIALVYDAKRMAAPRVLAKGQDEVAVKIREVASEHGIPRVENRPLAQTLYRTTEIGDTIPEDLFTAVAEVLALVYRSRQKP